LGLGGVNFKIATGATNRWMNERTNEHWTEPPTVGDIGDRSAAQRGAAPMATWAWSNPTAADERRDTVGERSSCGKGGSRSGRDAGEQNRPAAATARRTVSNAKVNTVADAAKALRAAVASDAAGVRCVSAMLAAYCDDVLAQHWMPSY